MPGQNNRKLLTVLLFTMVLSGTVHSLATFGLDADSIISGTFQSMGDWIGPSALALVTSAVLLAALYVFGSLMRNPQTTTYVKQELYELVISAILVVIVLGSVTTLSTLKIGNILPQNLLPGAGPTGSGFSGAQPIDSIYELTSDYFNLGGFYVGSWLEMNYVLNVFVDQFASVTPYARPLGVGLVATPFAGFFSPIKQLLYNMTVALSVAYLIMYAQLFVYIFSLEAFLHFYLPLGVFLRCFTPTRRVGGTLIGVSAAFLIIFPLVTVISFTILLSGLGSPIVSFHTFAGDFFTSAAHGGFTDTLTHFFRSHSGSGLTDIVTGTYGAIGDILQNTVGGLFTLILMIPLSTVALAFLFAFITPAFNLIVFVEAARRLSSSFGEQVDISSLTRMI